MTTKILHITAENHSKMLSEIRKLKNRFINVHAFTKNNPDGLQTTSFDYFYGYCCSYYNFTAKITLAYKNGDIWKETEGVKTVWKLQAPKGILTFFTKKQAVDFKKAQEGEN